MTQRPAPSFRSAMQEALIALSIANLCFLDVWAELLPAAASRESLYYYKNFAAPMHQPIALASVLVFAALLFAIRRAASRSGSVFAGWMSDGLLIFLTLVCLNAIRLQVTSRLFALLTKYLGKPGLAAAAALLAAAGAFVFVRKRGLIVRACEGFALVLSPLAFVVALQAIVAAAGPPSPALASPPPAGPLKKEISERPRVVLAIFDELDERMAFIARPKGLALPHLDALAAGSLHAQNAYPPGRSTLYSIPSYVTGRTVAEQHTVGPSQLQVRFEGEEALRSFKDVPTLFSVLRGEGYNVAVSGWYHPYCRLFPQHLARCRWESYTQNWDERPALQSLREQWLMAFRTIPLVYRLWRPLAELQYSHGIAYRSLLDAAVSMIADPAMDFVYLHLPVPHAPCIYDRMSTRLLAKRQCSYIDNLALADRALGELLASLESSDAAGRTTLVITSDHWWRWKIWNDWFGTTAEDRAVRPGEDDHRVPFLVRFPGDEAPLAYEPTFNTVHAGAIVAETLRGGLTSNETLARWLDAHREEQPSRYMP